MGALIDTRRDLARYLQAQMAASRGQWLAGPDDEEASGRAMLKTYLVEAHCGHGDEQTLEALRGVGNELGVNVEPRSEPGLFRLATPDVELWADTSMGRFWRIHTTALVKFADSLHERLVSAVPWLDRVWLPPNYLEKLPDTVGARMLTFSLNHDRRPLNRDDGPGTDSDYVTLRLWASHAARTLVRLRAADIFPHGVSIRSVRLRTGVDAADGDFCVAEYFHNGKVTASGTSFDEHNRLLVRVLRDYADLVQGIEDRFGLAATDQAGQPLVAGDPIIIDVDWTLPDLEYAVGRIFASAEPFRLWGLPERVAEGHYRARAVDLHVGGVIVFDITRKYVAIQLPRSVCGNTVVRFLNNIQCHVNSDAMSRS